MAYRAASRPSCGSRNSTAAWAAFAPWVSRWLPVSRTRLNRVSFQKLTYSVVIFSGTSRRASSASAHSGEVRGPPAAASAVRAAASSSRVRCRP